MCVYLSACSVLKWFIELRFLQLLHWAWLSTSNRHIEFLGLRIEMMVATAVCDPTSAFSGFCSEHATIAQDKARLSTPSSAYLNQPAPNPYRSQPASLGGLWFGFWDSGSPCRPGWTWTCNLLAFASQVSPCPVDFTFFKSPGHTRPTHKE